MGTLKFRVIEVGSRMVVARDWERKRNRVMFNIAVKKGKSSCHS